VAPPFFCCSLGHRLQMLGGARLHLKGQRSVGDRRLFEGGERLRMRVCHDAPSPKLSYLKVERHTIQLQASSCGNLLYWFRLLEGSQWENVGSCALLSAVLSVREDNERGQRKRGLYCCLPALREETAALTTLDGTANAKAVPCLATAAFTPITCPLRSRSGPPELPGWMLTSLWIMPV